MNNTIRLMSLPFGWTAVTIQVARDNYPTQKQAYKDELRGLPALDIYPTMFNYICNQPSPSLPIYPDHLNTRTWV